MKNYQKNYTVPQTPYAYTLEEVACKLGISKERVRQIENQAIRKIRKLSKPLFEYIYNR